MTLTDAMNQLAPGTTVTYIGQEGSQYWVEVALPSAHYTAPLVTDCADTPDAALAAVVRKALGYRREQEGRAA